MEHEIKDAESIDEFEQAALQAEKKKEAEEQLKKESQKKEESKALTPVVIEMTEQGSMKFSNQNELASVARMMIKLSLAPQHLRNDGPEAVASALVMCRQFNLPDTAMNEMSYVKGKLTVFGSLVTALAEKHPEYGEMESYFIDEKCEKICVENKNLKTAIPWAHIRRVRKKNSTVWNEYFFSVDDAQQAGLLTKTTKADSGWVKYTKDLLSHKTKARAYRENYSSALNGINYHEDVVEAISDTRDVVDVAAGLKNLINQESA